MRVAEIVGQLHAEGHAKVGQLAAEQIAEVVAHLRSRTAYPDCHVRFSAGAPGTFARYADRPVVCHHHYDVLTAPHLLELALGLTDVAAAWLGRDPPVMYSCNAFWTRPAGAVRPDIQAFHTDPDDTKFLPLFVLLTDVTEDDGAQEIEVDGQVRRIFGSAGTAFLSNTMLRHRGLQPRERERGIVWFRWGVSDKPWVYDHDQLSPVPQAWLGDRYPADPRLRQSIRLLAS